MRRLVTISFTGLNAGGGVPKFNRDLHAAFPDRECLHFCFDDIDPYLKEYGNRLPEWIKARALNAWLIDTKKITRDDVIVADGFWADCLDAFPLAVSHSHGIWSHLTKEDVDAGKRPDMPDHHMEQVLFRRRWVGLKKHIAAVSDFIAEQMRLQWGFVVDRVINNGVDTELFRPYEREMVLDDLLIIHGVNDRGNINKGWDHIELLKKSFPDAHVLSLDEAHVLFSQRGEWTKPEVLAQADLVVHPSGYEGNSMFVAEALSCGVPVVGYDVGFLWTQRNNIAMHVLPRSRRSPETTLTAVKVILEEQPDLIGMFGDISRIVAQENLSIELFKKNWRSYVEEIENAA